MKLLDRTAKAAAVLVSLAFLFPVAAFASVAPTFTANQTVANVATTNNQTLASSTVTANVPQTKASRTLTVNSVPVAAMGSTTTSVIGSCIVTYSTTTPDTLNCAGNAAILNVTTHASAPSVATALGSLISVSGNVNGHGPLTATSSGSTATFTTTGTEASSTPINFTDNTSGAVTSSSSTTGVVPVAQVFSVIPANAEVNDVFRVTINGTQVNYVATTTSTAGVLAGITAAINASSASTTVTATNTGSQVNVTANTAGTAFTLVTATINASPVAQSVVFTPTDPGAADVFVITLNGTTYAQTVSSTDTVATLVAALNTLLASNAAVTCSQNGIAVTCTSATAGTAFTYNALVNDNAPPSVGGGGGGSSHSSGSSAGSSSSSSSSNVNVSNSGSNTTTTTTTTSTGGVTTSVTISANLKVGSKGAQVLALQNWLIAKGYHISGGATGFFGAKTKAALVAFQKASGIVPASGFCGPKTRAYIASH